MEININSTAGGGAGVMQYSLNGSIVTVALDTGTPANSKPAPIILVDSTGAIQGSAANPINATLAANQSVNVAQVNGVAPLMGNGTTGTGSQRVTIASDNAAFAVNATLQAGANVIGALTANQSVNNAQINGVAPLMGNGITGTGSQRVTVASDNTPFAVKIDQSTPGTTNLVALAANQSVNVAQINGVAPLMGNGITGTGSQRVTVASDNTPFAVKIDQSTPGTTNLVALAANQSVNVAQINGVAVLMGAGNTGTGSQRVTIASDQAAVATKSPVNVSGGNSRISNLTTVAQTLTAPANTVGFILQAESANVDFVRWVIGTTASSTVGQQLQPGQDSGFVPCDANISIIANSGSSQAVNVIWILSA